MKFSPDDELLAVGFADGTVSLLQVEPLMRSLGQSISIIAFVIALHHPYTLHSELYTLYPTLYILNTNCTLYPTPNIRTLALQSQPESEISPLCR